MCETHNKPGNWYCRKCGEMTCDREDCHCACYACGCPCHNGKRVTHDDDA